MLQNSKLFEVVILKRKGCNNGAPELLAKAMEELSEGKVHVTVIRNVVEKHIDCDYLIRWGCTNSYYGRVRMATLNDKRSIQRTSNKGGFREELQSLGLDHTIPKTHFNARTLPPGTWLVRPIRHCQGQDFHIISSSAGPLSIQGLALEEKLGPVYYQEVLDIKKEYRIMFAYGKVVQIVERELEEGAGPAPQNNNKVVNVKWDKWPLGVLLNMIPVFECVREMFGAADIMVDNKGKAHLAEINTAPELYPYMAKCLAKGILDRLRLLPVQQRVSNREAAGREAWARGYRKYIHPAVIL